MNFNRFTKGFKFFGPYEQCNDGKYMLVEDHETIVAEHVAQFTNYVDYIHEREKLFDDTIEFYRPFYARFWLCLVGLFASISVNIILYYMLSKC